MNDDEDFVQLVRSKCLDAYPLTVASIEAALLALSEEMQPQVLRNIETLISERDRLRDALLNKDWVISPNYLNEQVILSLKEYSAFK